MNVFFKTLLLGAVILFSSRVSAQSDTIFLEVPNYSIAKDEVYTVDLSSKDFKEIIAFVGHVRFNTELLEFVEIVPGALPGLTLDNFNLDSAAFGHFRFLWDSFSPFSSDEDEPLFSITFKGIASGKIEGNLGFRDDIILPQAFDDPGDEFAVAFKFVSAPSGTSAPAVQKPLTIVPNPMHQNAQVTYKSAVNGSEYKLFDSTGRMVRFGAMPESGTLNLERRNLVPGLYNFSIEYKGKQLATEKLIVE